MGSKGSTSTSATTSTTRPDQQAYDLYSQLLQRAQGVANTPYQAYTGELTAGVNAQQNQGIAGINSNAYSAQPSVNTALGIAQQNAQPITASQIQNYMSPYTQNVVDATQNQFNSQNQQQQQQLTSNAIAQGALGGNRMGVAQANLSQAQQTAQAPVIAGLYGQGYNTALNTALTEQQAGQSGAANLASLGIAGQNAGLTGAGAQIGAGTLQQQTQQAQDTALYNQFQTAQAFPYQQTQWLAGLGTGVGSQMGGTSNSNGTQTTPGPSGASQWLGGIAGGAGILGQTGAFGSAGWLAPMLMASDERVKENIEEVGRLHDGQRIYRYNYKGDPQKRVGLIAQEVEHHHPEAVHERGGIKMVDYDSATQDAANGVAKRATGGGMDGTPYSGVSGFIPNMNITSGRGAPAAAPLSFGKPAQQSGLNGDQYKNLGSLAGAIKDGLGGKKAGDPLDLTPPNPTTDWDNVGPKQVDWDNVGPQQSFGLDFGSGAVYARGGVANFAEGGAPDSDAAVIPEPDNTDANSYLSPAVKQAVAPQPAAAPAGVAAPLERIKAIESSGKYEAVGPETTYKDGTKDHPYGAYGVMGRNIPEWTKETLGYAMTPEEFLNSPEAQDAVAKTKFGKYQDKYGPSGAARAWFAGEGGMNNPNARDVLGTSVSEYERRFNNGNPSGVAGQAAPSVERAAEGVGEGTAPKKEGLNWGADSKFWPALTAAGFAMMASRSPWVGTAIGEGGLAGMQQYGNERAREFQQQQESRQNRRVDLEAKRLEQQLAQKERELQLQEIPYKGVLTTEQKMRLAQQNAALEEQRRQHDLQLKNPVKIGTTKEGFDIYALPRAGKNGVEFYRIDPSNGKVDSSPMGMSFNNPALGQPAPPQSDQPAREQQQPGVVPAQYNPDEGVVRQNNKLIASGGVDYSEGAPYVEKGMDVPPPKEAAGRSPQAIQQDAEYYLQTGKLPPVRSGKSPVAIQQYNYARAVQNYGTALAASRGMTPDQVASAWREAPGMLRFVMGADGRATVSLGTAVRHLETVREYANAWAANDTQAINRIRGFLGREFGSDAATNLEAVGKIVGPEIVKAIGVAGAGTEGERSAVEKQFSTAASPAQIMGAITATQKLLAGQLEGKRRQASNAGVSEQRFRSLIGERPYEVLSQLESGAAHTPPPAATGAAAPPATAQAAIPPPEQREAGKVYTTPKGPFKWTGKGWAPP